MNVSILSYSFRGLLSAGVMDVFGYLESCRYRYGLQGADIWSSFIPSTEESFLRKLKEALTERELILADLCVDQAHIWEPTVEARRANAERARAFLQAAAYLGARFVRIDAGGQGDAWTNEQFDHIVAQYREYAQFAYNHGFKMGVENHWGPERLWPNLKRVFEAVNHPGFGVSCHIGGWGGSEEEKNAADVLVAPWVCHTHFAWNICTGPLLEKAKNLWNAGYQGYYSVEHHSGENEYSEVAMQVAQMRDAIGKLQQNCP